MCLTIDLWSNRQMKGFLGITAHYITDWTLHSAMLACTRFRGSHTAENISHQVDEVLTVYNIIPKVTNIITDNAANMIKAFTLPGYEVACDDGDDTNSDDADDDDLVQGHSITDDIHTAERIPCFAHTLQLVIRDGLKQAGPINKVLAKASAIVSHARRSTHCTDILEGERRLQAANATRWNSQLTMVRSLLQISETKLQLLDCPQLNRYQRNILQELCDILTPFETATNLLQGQNSVTSSLVVPSVRGLQTQLQQMATKYHCKLMTTLLSSFKHHMAVYAEKEIFILATVLDPRFKLKWASASDLEKLTTNLITHASVTAATHAAHSPECPPTKKTCVEADFLDLFMEPQPTQPTPTSVQLEVQDYLHQPVLDRSKDPLAFWSTHDSKYPHLASLTARYLAVPASSAPVERLFSIGGKIFRPERCRLSDMLFEELMFIRSNGHIV